MPPSVTRWVREKGEVRRLRERARTAARVGMRFGDDDSTHADLALLRALTLERELRLASLLRSGESVAALTRGVIESVLRGLYVLAQPDGLRERLGAETVLHLRKFSFFGEDTVSEVFEGFGDAYRDKYQRGMPDLRQATESVDAHHGFRIFTDQFLGSYLYHDWYLPLSNLAVHPSAAALSRYYKFRTSVVLKRPWQVVPRRGAIRVSDGAIAFLTVAILESRQEDASWERAYAERQIAGANLPLVMLFARVVLGQGPKILASTAYSAVRNRIVADPTAPRDRRERAMRSILKAMDPDATETELDERAAIFIEQVDGAVGRSINDGTK